MFTKTFEKQEQSPHRHSCFSFRANPKPHCNCLKELDCVRCPFYKADTNFKNNKQMAEFEQARRDQLYMPSKA